MTKGCGSQDCLQGSGMMWCRAEWDQDNSRQAKCYAVTLLGELGFHGISGTLELEDLPDFLMKSVMLA